MVRFSLKKKKKQEEEILVLLKKKDSNIFSDLEVFSRVQKNKKCCGGPGFGFDNKDTITFIFFVKNATVSVPSMNRGSHQSVSLGTIHLLVLLILLFIYVFFNPFILTWISKK